MQIVLFQFYVSSVKSTAALVSSWNHHLLGMKNEYCTSNDKILLLIASDRNTRPLWNGISDKEVGEYILEDDYCPRKINAGKKGSPFDVELFNSGVRIIRIRTNM